MADETTNADAANTAMQAQASQAPAAGAQTAVSLTAQGAAAETNSDLQNPNTPQGDIGLKVTALHLAIDHSRGERHGAGDIVEIAERFWKWLKTEVA